MADLTLTLAGPLGPTVGASGSRLYYPGETANGANAESFRAGDIRDGTWQETFTFAGDPVAGEVVTLTFASPKIVRNINAGPITVTYTVQGGDTLSTLAANVADAINGAGMTPFGVGAAASAGVVTVTYIALLAIVFTGSNTVITPPPPPVGFEYELFDYTFAQSVQLSPDNLYLYVQCWDVTDFFGVVIKVRLSDGAVVASQTFASDANWTFNGAPILLTPDGTKLYCAYASLADSANVVVAQLSATNLSILNTVTLDVLVAPPSGAFSIGLSDNGSILSVGREVPPIGGASQRVGFTFVNTSMWTWTNVALANVPNPFDTPSWAHVWDAGNAHIWIAGYNGNGPTFANYQLWKRSITDGSIVATIDLPASTNVAVGFHQRVNGFAVKSGSTAIFGLGATGGDPLNLLCVANIDTGSAIAEINPGPGMAWHPGGVAIAGAHAYLIDASAPPVGAVYKVPLAGGSLVAQAALGDPNGNGDEWEGIAVLSTELQLITAFDDSPLWIKGQAVI